MDFWGYPSDSCLFSFGKSQDPVTDLRSKQRKTINIFFIIRYLFPKSVTCYKYINKIQESNNKNLFF